MHGKVDKTECRELLVAVVVTDQINFSKSINLRTQFRTKYSCVFRFTSLFLFLVFSNHLHPPFQIRRPTLRLAWATQPRVAFEKEATMADNWVLHLEKWTRWKIQIGKTGKTWLWSCFMIFTHYPVCHFSRYHLYLVDCTTPSSIKSMVSSYLHLYFLQGSPQLTSSTHGECWEQNSRPSETKTPSAWSMTP